MNTNLFIVLGIGIVFLMTCLGSSTVFFFRESVSGKFQQILLGFAAGVMVAAAIWGLLLPSINETEARGGIGWIPAACGFLLGGAFLLGLDKLIPHLHPNSGTVEGPPSTSKRTTLLILAVALHNIPEGMAIGLSFALAVQSGDPALYSAALALAIGIGIQNFPEGVAVTLPLRQEGVPASKAFGMGVMSAAVEPVFGIVAVLLASFLIPIMPWLLAFAAGSMMYVVVEELIPEAHLGEHSNTGTLGVMAGFLLMMILNSALG